MKSIGGFKTDKIKLSDLIDESFFEDIEDSTSNQTPSAGGGGNKNNDKFTLQDLILHYK